MKRLVLVCSAILFLAGCGDRAVTSAPESPSDETQVAPSDKPPPDTPSSSKEAEEIEPVYIDESQYEGDELAFVQLINRSVQYINGEDEEGYKSLLTSNSPINAMPKRKVDKVELVEIGEPNGSQIAVFVNYWRDGVEQRHMFVFTKEQDEWKILDID